MLFNLCNFTIIIILVITINSIAGVLLPAYFFNENIAIYQIVFLSFFGTLTTFFSLNYVNKKLSFLHKIVDKMIKENPGSALPKPNKKYMFRNIHYFFNNLEKIIDSYNKLIEEQNILLNKNFLANYKLKKSSKVRDVMLEVSQSTIKINNTEEFFKLILEKLISTIEDADKGSFIVIVKDNFIEYKAAVGFDINKLKNIKFKLEETFLWKKSLGNITKPHIVKDIRSFDSQSLNDETYRALESMNALDIKTTLSTPIIIDNELYGMINIDSFNIDAFDDDDLLIAEYFSNQISTAIKNRQLIEKIVYLSRYDSMTNTYNKRYFEEVLYKFYSKAIRYNEIFSLVIFDLNDLKYINDTFGHIIGDTIISKFVEIIKDNIRESDLLARYGGDEFIGVFFNSDPVDIENRLLSITEYFENNPIEINDRKLFITFSYGIACFPEDSKDMHELIKLADKKMYDYKRKSKADLIDLDF